MNAIKTTLWLTLGVVTLVLALGLCLVGSLAVFGSFFFETSKPQLRDFLIHGGIFIGGSLSIGTGLLLLKTLVDKGMD